LIFIARSTARTVSISCRRQLHFANCGQTTA